MKKRYVVLDWYENIFVPYYVGEFDTREEAEEAVDNFEEDTDRECNIFIYDRTLELDANLLKSVGY